MKLAVITAHAGMLLQRGQKFKVLCWTFAAQLTNSVGNMFIAFRVICFNLFSPLKDFLEL